MTEILLINFLFLLFPVVVYLIFFENRVLLEKNQMLVFFLSSVSMVLCMTFPIRLDADFGFMFDLRYVPYIISSLFGGYIIAFPLYLVLNIYRFFLGGDGMLFSFYFSTAMVIFIPLWSGRFMKLGARKRIVSAVVLTFVTMLLFFTTIIPFYPSVGEEYWKMAVSVLIIHVVATFIIMILIEKIIVNVKTRERLFQSDRLHLMSELSASVSHEIRNPLTVTSGFLQLLHTSKNIDEKEKGYIDLSIKELNRAENIVSDFLSIAKPQAKNMVHSNLKYETEYVNNIMVAYANMHQVTLDFQFNNKVYKKFDQNQIQQCLINLYKNGIESMKESGGILSIHVSNQNDKIIIVIKDSGIGMTEQEVARMGDPYYSTKKEGTGLGMLMVYSTINKLGGKIDIDSKKRVGTTFRITL
ncbi:sensor histidine kinase [Salipaludibacillus daqingensis]|uniref:ATP-binding protein n=1 Tax=Salipaludibacillus daqingensis TaxID=3041001 RepID=UPI0024738B33|nr:sensor histidine kinase [Salipaludibacillus daqingensis]